jgi:hypothetical protein
LLQLPRWSLALIPLLAACSARPLPLPLPTETTPLPPPDMAATADMAAMADMADMAAPSVPDLAAPADLAQPPPDLAAPADLAQPPPDLAAPADLAQPPPDLVTVADLACIPESDGELCDKANASCDPITTVDRCGHARTVDCGSCSGATPACIAHVCRATVCGTRFSAHGTAVASVSQSGVQEALLGASADGNTLLYLRGTPTACVFLPGARLLLADAATSGGMDYTSQDITALPNLAGFTQAEETMTLTPDGNTIIGVARSGGFKLSSRSGAGNIDFGPASAGPFTAINTQLGSATVMWPVLSPDRLAFYYNVVVGSSALVTGTYESIRGSTTAAFPAGTLMPPAVQSWTAVSAISSDRLTLFVTQNFGTSLMGRGSLLQPFSNLATQQPPGSAYRVVPIDGCQKLIGTCEPGGCLNEDICVWSAVP